MIRLSHLDRASMLRLAASMARGSGHRRTILSFLKEGAEPPPNPWEATESPKDLTPEELKADFKAGLSLN